MADFSASVTSAEWRRLGEFLAALRTPCLAAMAKDSVYNTVEFEGEFRSKLLTHHCFMGSPLVEESFESAFYAACKSAGHEVERRPAGYRFWDVRVDGRRISLKSTKAKQLKRSRLHISKLTEAAWIQDCRTAAIRREKTLKLFREYCSEVDAIIQLRYFQDARQYELVELPALVLAQVQELGREHFSADGPTINIPVGKEPPDFTLKIDRSDAKITIANINKDVCLVHGTWQL